MRRGRVWAGIIGAVIGWGLAGLDGGFAGTVDIPQPRTDFVAKGMIISSRDGTMTFDVTRDGRLLRQVVQAADEPVETLFERFGARLAVIDSGRAAVPPTDSATASLLDPFGRAALEADGPLHYERVGLGSHIGIVCEHYRATGTANGRLLRATACITADGVPLVSTILSTDLTVRTEITEIDFAPADLDVSTDRAVPTSDLIIDPTIDPTIDNAISG